MAERRSGSPAWRRGRGVEQVISRQGPRGLLGRGPPRQRPVAHVFAVEPVDRRRRRGRAGHRDQDPHRPSHASETATRQRKANRNDPFALWMRASRRPNGARSHRTRCRRPPGRDLSRCRYCIRGKAAALPALPSSMRLGTAGSAEQAAKGCCFRPGSERVVGRGTDDRSGRRPSAPGGPSRATAIARRSGHAAAASSGSRWSSNSRVCVSTIDTLVPVAVR